MSVREARFADDRWYPSAPERLHEQLSALVEPAPNPERAIAVVSPHAGYFYSGAVAGALFGRIAVPDRAIVIGPNHRGIGARRAVQSHGAWRVPGVEVSIDHEAALKLRHQAPGLRDDPSAFATEHSLEVQLPFLVHRNPSLSFVPIALYLSRYDDCRALGEAIARTVAELEGPTLIVASSDMNHYAPSEVGRRKDRLAIDQMLALDPAGLYRVVTEEQISMCGVGPAVVALHAARTLGASRAELIRYADSGDASGDRSSVVGYAALRFW